MKVAEEAQRREEEAAREKTARESFKAAQDQALAFYNQALDRAREAKQAGASEEQLAPLRQAAKSALAQYGATLEYLRASGAAAGFDAQGIPQANQFVGEYMEMFDAQIGAIPAPATPQMEAENERAKLAALLEREPSAEEIAKHAGVALPAPAPTPQMEATRERQKLTALLGREPTQAEMAKHAGVALPEDGVREKRIEELQGRGFSRDSASDIAAGDIKVIGPDQFGNIFTVNRVTNERRRVVGKQAEYLVSPEFQQQGQAQGPVPIASLSGAVGKGTGPLAYTQEAISNVFGPFVSGAMFPETTRSRERVRVFSQLAKSALVNNPKFPVAEQKIVQQLLPDVGKFFQDPDAAREKLKELKSVLEGFKGIKQSQASSDKLTQKRRGELSDQISRIDEVLAFIGDEYPIYVNPQTRERIRYNPETNEYEPVQ